MPYLKVKDGIDIFYECYGEGEPLVFIHGLGASSDMYKPQVEYFQEYFKVILLDLRGNGKSGLLECDVESVLNKQAEDIKGLLKLLEIHLATFIGVSYGGVLIQQVAIKFPEIVKSLIIVDSFCDTSIDSYQKLFAMVGANQTWILHTPKKWLAKLTKSSYKKWPEACKEMENIILNMRIYETKLQRKAINRIRFNDKLSKVKLPALCLVGDHTNLGKKMMEQVSGCIQNSELKVIKNSFDPSNLCQPMVFNKIVHKFISNSL
ncbi:alpha/beta fold hydrolase [Halalkalibacter nanhaiisediminis]|uniref:Pimeloyl-ACP methyl ester carboxylesterase n=1 Tax=Halalkalibacter nanhaiisediminis TaxID=688079 RepID=A0A562QPN9_9BACI|nr:alpha/beta hydrolase [Halalkalibacter nanhaiisediminis]TWI58026.1 pimeloyl-ACP methyl ester carboxylesterase [Halalkalibacter nanhaiisediminis]